MINYRTLQHEPSQSQTLCATTKPGHTLLIALPDLPVYFVGITPSPRRWSVWNVAQQTNELIREWSASQLHLYFIDTAADLLGDDGVPNPENYIIDGLHLSDKGYEIWTGIIKPRLIADFPASGKQA